MTLRKLVEMFHEVRVLVTGDPMLDIYHYGTVDRLSPEAPAPVFVETGSNTYPGGAANVYEQLEQLNVDAEHHFPKQWWTEKHRYLVNGQQLFRIDKDMHHYAEGMPNLTSIDAIVMSDYGKSWLGADYCRSLIAEARKHHIPVVVDPKGTGWAKFDGCTVICPNEVEAKNPEIKAFDVVLYKKGAQGLLLKDHTWEHAFPAVARQVYDVTGAGDTVVATVAAVLACGGNLHEAARLANIAAGAVVGKRGTATVTNDELLDLVGNQ